MNQLRQRRAREARLYGIVDLGYIAFDDCIGVTRSLLAGGVDILQLRAKNQEESSKFARKIKKKYSNTSKSLPICYPTLIPSGE